MYYHQYYQSPLPTILMAMMLNIILAPNHRSSSFVWSQSVNFTDCGDGNVKDVRISPCLGNNPCILKLGTNVTVEADFVAPFNANKLYEVIKGVIRGREMPFPEQRVDPCNSGNILPSCPIKQGEDYQFKAWFEVKPFYPPISLKVKYSLTDPSGKKIACVQVATKIIDPNPQRLVGNQRGRNRSKSARNSVGKINKQQKQPKTNNNDHNFAKNNNNK